MTTWFNILFEGFFMEPYDSKIKLLSNIKVVVGNTRYAAQGFE
jgi:hypothetical protein